MKTFSQRDYVNRLERLLGLIRITICLCNYTLSTGNMGHYPTAPLDLHNISWSRRVSRRAACSSRNQTLQYLDPFLLRRNAPQIPDVVFYCRYLMSSPSGGSPESAQPHPADPAADDFRSWLGFRDVADRSLGNSGMRSLPLLIKSVSQVSVLIWAAVLRERDWQYLVLKKKNIAHPLLRLNVIGCFRSQGYGFSVNCFFFFLLLRCHFQGRLNSIGSLEPLISF